MIPEDDYNDANAKITRNQSTRKFKRNKQILLKDRLICLLIVCRLLVKGTNTVYAE